MKYNFVFFDNSDEYYRIARRDLCQISDECIIREKGLQSNSKILTNIFRSHFSPAINNIIKLPMKKIWRSKYIGELKFGDNKPICFLFSTDLDKFFEMDLFSYLRDRYPNCKLVFMLRDRVEVYLSKLSKVDLARINNTFDIIYTINDMDVRKHGYSKINVMCSYYPVDTDETIPESDIVFIGKAKDRAEKICSIYTKLSQSGVKCDFVLISNNKLNVPEGITVTNRPMHYTEMLKRTIRSRCILEVTQREISSISSRCLEALCYNKRLLTDISDITKYDFYDSRYIHVFNKPDDIDPTFVLDDSIVDYHYDGYFSPIRLLSKIDNDIMKL